MGNRATISSVLKEARFQSGLSLDEIAARSGVTVKQLTDIEKGKTEDFYSVAVCRKAAFAYAQALHVEQQVEQLWSDADWSPDPDPLGRYPLSVESKAPSLFSSTAKPASGWALSTKVYGVGLLGLLMSVVAIALWRVNSPEPPEMPVLARVSPSIDTPVSAPAASQVAEKEQLAKLVAEKGELEKALAAERAALDKALATQRASLEKGFAAEKALLEKALANEKAAREKAVADRLAAEKRVAEKQAIAERIASDRLTADKFAAEKAALERQLASQRLAVEKTLLAEKAALEKALAAERAARDKAAASRQAAEKVGVEERPAARANATPAQPAAAAPAQSAVAGSSASRLQSQVELGLRDFAAHWSARQADAFLNLFDASFPGFQAYAANRRARMKSASFIEVKLEAVTLKETAPGEITAQFTQRYRSDTFQSVERKELVWRQTSAGPRIFLERKIN